MEKLYKYEKVTIFYFSGTGNAQKVAQWFADTAKENNIVPQVIPIADNQQKITELNDKNEFIVFVSPVHGFNYPPIMLNFIANFPKGKNDVLLMNTRAGMLIGNFVTPGLSGITFYLAALILKLKGFSISGMCPIDLPSNWISLHPGLRKKAIIILHRKNREKVKRIARMSLEGKKNFKALREIIQDTLISPIALLYYILGRFFLAKTFYATSACNDCGLCYKKCPVQAIKKFRSRPFWTLQCESCMKCMSHCPKEAIQTGHGYSIGAIVLYYSVMVAAFEYFVDVSFQNEALNWLYYIIKSGLFIAFMAILYKTVYLFLPIKWIEKIVEYTSLTHYKFWGKRYKALKDKEFL